MFGTRGITPRLCVIIIEDDTPRNGAASVGEIDARYGGDHFLHDPHCEPTTIKLTQRNKTHLLEFAKDEGYTSLGPAIRELIAIGLKYYPVEGYERAQGTHQKHKDDPMVRKFFGPAR